ncbi:hypothetical protein CSUI_006529 [Cystoisospora suis]|uniref:Uncharacterized protein n=1 Tax=Cystoisospora suis TaxID=483139 RepID=A0A2C6K005_9APIC|nr:hypothetical protein CSUI_006529 [Cystoisospora suis]
MVEQPTADRQVHGSIPCAPFVVVVISDWWALYSGSAKVVECG